MTVDYSVLTNEALFDLYCKGDLAAFDGYYARVSPKMWGFIKRRVPTVAQAEDIYQEVWIKVHRSRDQYDPKYPINPWVFTIARSVLYDGLRLVQRTKEQSVEDSVLEQKLNQASVDSAGETTTMPDWDQQFVDLSPDQKNMIELRYLKEWSFDEIAKSLGLNEDNVRQKISRIVRKLRRRVA